MSLTLDYKRCRDNWCIKVKHIMNQIGLGHYCDINCAVDLRLEGSYLTNFYSEISKHYLENAKSEQSGKVTHDPT